MEVEHRVTRPLVCVPWLMRCPPVVAMVGRVVAIVVLTVLATACGDTGDASGPADEVGTDRLITSDDSDAGAGTADPVESTGGSVDREPAGASPDVDSVGGPPEAQVPRAGDAGDADGSAASAPQAIHIPDIEMIDVASGGAVSLRSLADGQRPMLLWFWAPH